MDRTSTCRRLIFNTVAIVSLSTAAHAQPPEVRDVLTFPCTNRDYGNTLVAMPNDEFVIAGHTYYTGSNRVHTFLRKSNASGVEQWYRQYEDTLTPASFRDAIATLDGQSIIAVGGTSGGGRVDMINLDGHHLLSQHIVGNGYQTITSITRTNSGDYLCATSHNFSIGTGIKGAVHKVTADFDYDTTWYYGDGNESKIVFSEIVALSSGFIAVGSRNNYFPPYDEHAFLTIADSTGNSLYQYRLNTGDSSTHFNSICKITDSMYVIAGRIAYNERNLLLVAINQNGETLWMRHFDYAPFVQLPKVIRTANGDILVLCSDFDFDELVLLKCNKYGDSLWSIRYQDSSVLELINGDIALRHDGGYNLLCTATFIDGSFQNRIVSVVPDSSDSAAAASNIPLAVNFVLGQNYPNPFNGETNIPFAVLVQEHIKLEVFDILGRRVAHLLEENVSRGQYTVPFTAKGISSGQLFYRLTSSGNAETKRMTYLR